MDSKSKPRSAEMFPGPGFRIKTDFPRLPVDLMESFREFSTPDISDLLNRLYALDPAIQCLTARDQGVVGPACTVRVFPGDNLMVHKALDVARPGDLLVIAAGGTQAANAVLGDLVSTKARHRGIAGCIVDGLIRDLPGIIDTGLPVYARGTTPVGPLHRGPGELNYAVACGGVVIQPGDVIVADAAGVVGIPRGIAAELLSRLRSHRDANAAYFEAVRRGDFSNAWVDRQLAEAECPMIEPSAEELGDQSGFRERRLVTGAAARR